MEPIVSLLGNWAGSLNIYSILLRLVLCLLLSSIIGCERASKRHSAGLRTFIVISLGATFVGMIDMFLIETYSFGFAILSAGAIISFAYLCTNSVLFSSKNQIKGLTTSVALWACGILGICIGMGMYTVAILGFVILFFCLSVLPKLEIYLKNRSNHFEIHLELSSRNKLPEFVGTMRKLGVRIDDIEQNSSYHNSGLSVYSVSLTIVSQELKKYKTHTEIIEAINSLEYVNYIEEMK